MIIKRLLILTPLAVFLFFLVSFLVASRNFDRKINQLILSSSGDAEKLNPVLSLDSASSDINGFVFNGLVKYNEHQELVGDLATGWRIEQESWFYLKPDAELAPEEAVARLRQELAGGGLEAAQIVSLEVAPKRGVHLLARRAGKFIESELRKVVPEQLLRPVHTLPIMVETSRKLADGQPANAAAVIARLTAALAAHPTLGAQLLEVIPDASYRFEVVALGEVGELRAWLEAFGEELAEKPATPAAAKKPAPLLRIAAAGRELFVHEPIITFSLRDDVRWHDGKPFTAEDVEFTLQAILDEKTNTVRRPMFDLVKSFTIVDPQTVRVRYKRPFSASLPNWSMGIIPKHLFAGQDINSSPYNRRPIGTGPFKFEEWVSDEQITVVANPDSFEGRPYLDRIAYRIIPEAPLTELEFMTKGVDLHAPQPQQYARISADERFQVLERLANGYTYIGYNQKVELFKDVRVRRALTMAINRQEIVDFLLYGLGVISTGPFPPQMWYANPDVPPIPYDPARAKALLAEAGWRDSDGDGILDKDGKRFSFVLMTNNGNIVRQNVAVLVQRALKEIGIEVEIELYEWSVFIRDKINPRNFEACVLGWSLSLDPDVYELWHSSQIEKGFNFIAYSNPEVDRLLELGRTTYDQGEQEKVYRRIHQLIYDDQPYTFLFVAKATPALHRDEFRIRRQVDHQVITEPIRMTEVGLLYYLTKWYRARYGAMLAQ